MMTRDVYRRMLLSVSGAWKAHKDRLGEIDAVFGDGDHGVAMLRIAQFIEQEVQTWEGASLKAFTDGLGMGIMDIGGGSAGPLYGTWISGLAVPLAEDTADIDAALLQRMLEAGRQELYHITPARVGGKTMMDVIIPAVDAALAAPQKTGQVLAAAAQAARQAAEAAEGLVASFGRAKNHGAKAVGTPDAGAESAALFFQALEAGYLASTQGEHVKEDIP